MLGFETVLSLVPSAPQKPLSNSTQPVITFHSHSAMGNGPTHDMTLLCIIVGIKYAVHQDHSHEVNDAGGEGPHLAHQRGCSLLLSPLLTIHKIIVFITLYKNYHKQQ